MSLVQESASLSRCFLSCHWICHLERVCLGLGCPRYANVPLSIYIFIFGDIGLPGLNEHASDDGAFSRYQAINEREGEGERGGEVERELRVFRGLGGLFCPSVLC